MTLKKKAFKNIELKGENAGDQHFLMFPPCFLPISKKRLPKKALENIVGKGVNAGNQHFPLFPQCFLLFPTHLNI